MRSTTADHHVKPEMIKYLLDGNDFLFQEKVNSYIHQRAAFIHSTNKPEYWLNFVCAGLRHAPYGPQFKASRPEIYYLSKHAQDQEKKLVFEKNENSAVLIIKDDNKVIALKVKAFCIKSPSTPAK